MESSSSPETTIDQRIAQRLKILRGERRWSLDQLARQSGISRATLSRLENAEVSPTASVLGTLCATYGMTLSRLMMMVEDDFEPLVRYDAQVEWLDRSTGFRRRTVSPPSRGLAGEALAGQLDPGARIAYERPPRPGLEHHLILLDGHLEITLDHRSYALSAGDCLRYQLSGASVFATPPDSGAHYILFIV